MSRRYKRGRTRGEERAGKNEEERGRKTAGGRTRKKGRGRKTEGGLRGDAHLFRQGVDAKHGAPLVAPRDDQHALRAGKRAVSQLRLERLPLPLDVVVAAAAAPVQLAQESRRRKRADEDDALHGWFAVRVCGRPHGRSPSRHLLEVVGQVRDGDVDGLCFVGVQEDGAAPEVQAAAGGREAHDGWFKHAVSWPEPSGVTTRLSTAKKLRSRFGREP
ncbi:hypothetical protein VTK73DRAFT_2949 [Phialemonium thermophilum]|uniref:Uncharacterized protein n=1 Tax=Phialemonium thermophilum TaxID=223376 RepID=A0ABR3VME7_9PEZI